MDYFQIPVHVTPVLRTVADFLVRLPIEEATVRVETVGDWAAELAGGPPESDCDLPHARRSANLPVRQVELTKLLGGTTDVRAVHYYPRGGGMGWHTNSNSAGWRVYVPRVHGLPPDSGIALADRRVPDRQDYANVFRVGADAWHAVYANTARFSAGIRFADNDPFIQAVLRHPDLLVR